MLIDLNAKIKAPPPKKKKKKKIIIIIIIIITITPHRKIKFFIMDTAITCRFGHIYWRNL